MSQPLASSEAGLSNLRRCKRSRLSAESSQVVRAPSLGAVLRHVDACLHFKSQSHHHFDSCVSVCGACRSRRGWPWWLHEWRRQCVLWSTVAAGDLCWLQREKLTKQLLKRLGWSGTLS